MLSCLERGSTVLGYGSYNFNKLMNEKMTFEKGLKGVSYMTILRKVSLSKGLASAEALGESMCDMLVEEQGVQCD